LEEDAKEKEPGLCVFLLWYFHQHIEGQRDFWGFNYDISI